MNKVDQQKPSSSHLAINSDNKKLAVDPDKSSIISIVCRICYDDDRDEPIVTPCWCKGTVAFVHGTCLETWLAESNLTSCELCHYVYRTERTPKYTAKESIWRWFRNHSQNPGFPVRGLRSDLYVCAILTPLAIILTYVCLFSADYYNQKKFANVPAVRWTSISLLLMISIMIFAYYLWAYMRIKYYGRTWYYCWQRDCVVRYISPSVESLCQIPSITEESSLTNSNENANVELAILTNSMTPAIINVDEHPEMSLQVMNATENINAENITVHYSAV
ncbi:hypothetical protein FQA39_LY11116 [Lamprigera yunnana]|nr:hypothetical protein FQA39_LY11116 [Lamprigera yunnana]